MHKDIKSYNASQAEPDRKICEILKQIIDKNLHFTERKIWHAHPVWFINGNPIVGYSKLKESVKLMFWSGADFDEKELSLGTGKFKDASASYTNTEQINEENIKRWLRKSEKIQWDYKNIVKRKGILKKII